jgi:dTDP-4-dehydrorhamnose 3,5-epimerase
MHKRLAIPEIILIESKQFKDSRGYFTVTHNKREMDEIVGHDVNFVQDNLSKSSRHVLRGLHYQTQSAQDKLVRVVEGEIFDVAIDMRREAPTLGQWVGERLSGENGRQLWIPKGFAHGFLVLSEFAFVTYKVTDFWSPKDERCLIWNDSDVGIEWPIEGAPILSDKDAIGDSFSKAEYF